MSSTLRGVVLAGGSGSRLLPLTRTVNKHLLPVGTVPMIYHPVRSLVSAGIADILVVTGVEHIGDIVSQLRSGSDFGCHFTYKCQDDPLGIADALLLAEDFARGSSIAVILGDNIFEDDLSAPLSRYHSGAGAQIHLKTVDDPHRFGVPCFDAEGRLVSVIEKPTDPPSSYAVTGLYCYDAQVFDFIRALEPSARGEYEISDVNTRYIALGQMRHEVLSGYWSDAGTHRSLQRANHYVLGITP
ncbi:MAG: glucose-1-phosphate thymidylyltransferase [Myxococcota bacterium]|jgi:glucose-1-phosphate thymidylyltransferase